MCYSRYTMIRKLKNKTAKTVSDAMLDIIKTYGSPNYINCDKSFKTLEPHHHHL